MNRIFIQLFSLIALSVLLFSCSKDKVDPQNIITDSQGVKIHLTWTVNGGQSSASAADLDLYLYKGTTEADAVEISSSTAFSTTRTTETINLTSLNDNSSYFVKVKYFGGSTTSNVDYKIEVIGLSTNKTQTLTSYFSAADKGLRATLAKIVKSTDTYRVDRVSAN
jgi:hypothetical protein